MSNRIVRLRFATHRQRWDFFFGAVKALVTGRVILSFEEGSSDQPLEEQRSARSYFEQRTSRPITPDQERALDEMFSHMSVGFEKIFGKKSSKE